ncbi:hypothetical protein HRG_006485 [Hirsutella rhossiliensis]|uniref:Uncharacterized protein n=1 Tax=Hirsutella rhossiliensis TaxID=111463 RepID=A0A9P8MUJ3_9HYPO|nr:uncharacterized protein HRG_06485 [Hirsutella rhossiliensis]KAH0962383.1 hypothetical protein HRG_06485 [Hirsutella rhossiliensis]
MTLSKQKRARPTIEPIKTNAIALQSLPKRVLTPLRCSLCTASPSSSRILLEIASPLDASRPGSTTEARFGSLNSAAADHCITPLSLDSAKAELSPSGPDKQERPEEASGVDSPTAKTDGACCARCGAPSGRRQPLSVLTATTRNLVQFQRYREILWRQGHKQFGNAGHDACFVVPEEIRQPRVAGLGEGPNGAQSPIADESRLPVRAVIRSRDRRPISLKREFDLRELRATIPEPIPSPRSPNFDRSSLLAPFSPNGGAALLSPAAAAYTGPVTRRASAEQRNLEAAAASPSGERRRSAGPRPVPIHLPYARAQLPVLAAIMLSDQVQSGSTIYLPMPHPKAWAETAAYVYTGEEQLLSKQAKANIWYLGGKV